MDINNSEECLDLLQLIEEDSRISQRELARKSGLSLGKVNYCIKALAEIGYIKINNFKNSNNKLNYIYLLTPIGLRNKAIITKKFLLRENGLLFPSQPLYRSLQLFIVFLCLIYMHQKLCLFL
jgi:EPS-associated MarR family transcriptional regulator